MLSRFLTVKEQLVLLFLGSTVAVGSLALYVHSRVTTGAEAEAAPGVTTLPDEPAKVVEEFEPAAPPVAELVDIAPEAAPQEVVVSLQGAVRRPGVYTLEAGARVQDLLETAGGPETRADLSGINLAAKLVDATTLTVPGSYEGVADEERWKVDQEWTAAANNPAPYSVSRQQIAASSAASDGTSGTNTGGGLIDLNSATQAELETLPGIGPAYASAIIRMREQTPFRTVDDVQRVHGIGPKRLEAIRSLVTVK